MAEVHSNFLRFLQDEMPVWWDGHSMSFAPECGKGREHPNLNQVLDEMFLQDTDTKLQRQCLSYANA
eukprot:5205306-Amphidinium_carterae.2